MTWRWRHICPLLARMRCFEQNCLCVVSVTKIIMVDFHFANWNRNGKKMIMPNQSRSLVLRLQRYQWIRRSLQLTRKRKGQVWQLDSCFAAVIGLNSKVLNFREVSPLEVIPLLNKQGRSVILAAIMFKLDLRCLRAQGWLRRVSGNTLQKKFLKSDENCSLGVEKTKRDFVDSESQKTSKLWITTLLHFLGNSRSGWKSQKGGIACLSWS